MKKVYLDVRNRKEAQLKAHYKNNYVIYYFDVQLCTENFSN